MRLGEWEEQRFGEGRGEVWGGERGEVWEAGELKFGKGDQRRLRKRIEEVCGEGEESFGVGER